MKKPEMKDYNLKNDDFRLYERQNEIYKDKEKAIRIECEKYNKILSVVISIFIIIYGIVVFTHILKNKENSSTTFVVLSMYGIPSVISIILKMYTINSDVEWADVIVSLLFMSFIGMGYVIFLCLKKEVFLDKYKYIDRNLEEKISKFNDDVKKYNEFLKRTKIEFWKNLSGYEFEREVAKLFSFIGYETRVTKASGDGGVDIILNKGNERIAVQCKHHKSKVGPNDVRALQGVVYNGDFTSGIFVSLSGFTPTVTQELKHSKIKIKLITLKDILEIYSINEKDEIIEIDIYGNHKPKNNQNKKKYRITSTGAITQDDED